MRVSDDFRSRTLQHLRSAVPLTVGTVAKSLRVPAYSNQDSTSVDLSLITSKGCNAGSCRRTRIALNIRPHVKCPIFICEEHGCFCVCICDGIAGRRTYRAEYLGELSKKSVEAITPRGLPALFFQTARPVAPESFNDGASRFV